MSSAAKKRKLEEQARIAAENEKRHKEIKKYAKDINLGIEEGLFGDNDVTQGKGSDSNTHLLKCARKSAQSF